MNSIKVVLEWRDQKALIIYMQRLLTTALVCVRTDLANSFLWDLTLETLLHLGLGPTESVMEQ